MVETPVDGARELQQTIVIERVGRSGRSLGGKALIFDVDQISAERFIELGPRSTQNKHIAMCTEGHVVPPSDC